MGKRDNNKNISKERRSEPRSIVDKYSSVEFTTGDLGFLFQFKIWETSLSGMSILVKEDSSLLEYLKVGDIIDMKYYPEELPSESITLKTEIKHITKDVPERIKGHYLVGLSIIGKRNEDD